MIDPTSRDLLGYLLGALDGSEQAMVEESLRTDPLAREELARAERRLVPLAASRREHAPPPGHSVSLVHGAPLLVPPRQSFPGKRSRNSVSATLTALLVHVGGLVTAHPLVATPTIANIAAGNTHANRPTHETALRLLRMRSSLKRENGKMSGKSLQDVGNR